MTDETPVSKWRRSVVGGKTAINVGGKVLTYLAKKPFLPDEKKAVLKTELNRSSASTIFEALTLLKGTALKIAQMLSFELDLMPSEIRQELEKSYNQVPPMNRALARKVVTSAFGTPPESIFGSFDTRAFAAASLGQVHQAVTKNGKNLAVKVQYPGIGNTIKNDIQLVKNMIKPLSEAKIVMPMLDEVELRLMEEIDYQREAENLVFFREHLRLDHVVIPDLSSEFSNDKVISMAMLDGVSLDQWIKTGPDQQSRDHVAGVLNNIFLESLYQLNILHADPNPGNFIIRDDLTVGLIDFGCVKKLDSSLVREYQTLCRVISSGNPQDYFELLRSRVLVKDIPPRIEQKLFGLVSQTARWFIQIYQDETFDFKANPDFMLEGKQRFSSLFKYRKYFQGNPEILFLDRTRYGLFRIFERLRARVRIRNPYEVRL